MTLSEFKAWLAGFTSNMGVYPSQDEWEEILKTLEQVKETVQYVPVSIPVPVPGLPVSPWPPIPASPSWQPLPLICTISSTSGSNLS